MHDVQPSSLDEFLAAPLETVAAVAPASMLYAPGGTRRSAVFNGIEPWTREYIEWGWLETLKCVNIILKLGVRNLFLPLFMSGHVREHEGNSIELAQMVAQHLANPLMLTKLAQYGWRVRLIDANHSSMLKHVADAFAEATSKDAQSTLWLITSSSIESQWDFLFQIAGRQDIQTRKQAIIAVYGEPIPFIDLFLGFGKPIVTPELFPPLLQGEVQCYWSQQAGYSLTERQFRMILYDYAFVRPTWQKDKTSRAKTADPDQALWQSEFILGLGRRAGPFWYPDMNGYPQELLP